jgi:hypothetical protein
MFSSASPPATNEFYGTVFIPTYLKGRVGNRDFRPVAERLKGGNVLVRCRNNPSFWLEINFDAATVTGCIGEGCDPDPPAAANRAPGEFVTNKRHKTMMRIDHTSCDPFWLEIAL